MKKSFKSLPYVSAWIGGVALMALVIFQLKEMIINRIHETELEAFKKTEILFQARFNTFIYGLQGMAGVLHASGLDITPAQLKNYSDLRDSFKNMPGALGYGFIKRVPDSEFSDYVRRQKKLDANFEVKSLSANPPAYFIIQRVEPVSVNRPAIGLNVASEKNRYQAAVLAMETGLPALTRPIELVQDSVKGVGFLFFYPVYKTAIPPKIQSDRIRDLVGWAYAPIQLGRYMEQVKLTVDARLSLKIEDLTEREAPILLYQDPLDVSREYEYEGNFEIGQRRWRIKAAVPDQSTHIFADAAALIIFIFLAIAHAVMMGIMWRNTEKKDKSEEKFKEAESWRSAILNSSNYSIIAANPDGIIQTFNRKAEEMLGYRAEEVVGKASPAIIHDLQEVVACSEVVSRELGRKIEPGFDTFVAVSREMNKPDTREWTYIRKDGTRFPVKLCVTCMRDSEGVIQGYMGIAEDISEIKGLEAMVKDQQTMLISSAKMSALGEMAGGVAHEINNPLAIISSRISMMLMKIQSGKMNTDDVKSDLEKIEATAHRIGKIIRGLRSFSRDGSKDEFAVVSVNKIIEDTLDLCRERFTKNGVEMRIIGDTQIDLNCRSVQVSQVLMNLVGNAFDAIKDLPEKWIEITIEAIPSQLFIKVTDSGNGIAPDVASKMLEPFFTTKDVGLGTGLGLSISKGIVESHGGVMYYNAKSKNTQFIIELPR